MAQPSDACITEIDISRPSRALAVLRWSDYILVVGCGLGAVGTLPDLGRTVVNGQWVDFLIAAAMASVLAFAAYTGWRHVGVIDPRVWRTYALVFPCLVITSALLGLSVFVTVSSLGALFEDGDILVGLIGFLQLAAISVPGFICILLLMRTRIEPIGESLVSLLSGLARRGGMSALDAARIQPIGKGRGLAFGLGGAALLLGTTFAPIPWPEPGEPVSPAVRMIPQIQILAFFLIVRARRYFQVSADSLLAVDKRPPILFLRSFTDDERQKYGNSQRALLDFSLETRLANHFSPFGPFIAIGSPKETVPQPGAARVLLSDDEWQPRVLGWMREASIIVMYGGATRWVNWELRQVIESGRATSLILMFPEVKGWRPALRKRDIAARTEQIRRVFQDTPWHEELTQFSDYAGLRAMLFRADGSMVMIKSRSRSRDAYHLAALIAHEQLLDPANVSESAEAGVAAASRWRLGKALAGTAAAVATIVGAAYLFDPTESTRLTFKQGELYYDASVSREEASGVGQYLVEESYFSDEAPRSVQFGLDQGVYRLQFVIDPAYTENRLAANWFAVLGGEIAREVLGGKPTQVELVDQTLEPIKVLPATAIQTFGKGELYYTDPITEGEARGVGQYLQQQQFFSDETPHVVQLGLDQGVYRLEFAIDRAYADDPLVAIQLALIAGGVAREVLGGEPIEVELADPTLQPIKIVPATAVLQFRKGELYYTDAITMDEAMRVGEQLVEAGIFRDEAEASVHFSREEGAYQLKFIVDPSRATDPGLLDLFSDLGRTIAAQALAGRPVVVHLCDDEFRSLNQRRVEAPAN